MIGSVGLNSSSPTAQPNAEPETLEALQSRYAGLLSDSIAGGTSQQTLGQMLRDLGGLVEGMSSQGAQPAVSAPTSPKETPTNGIESVADMLFGIATLLSGSLDLRG